MDNDQQLKIILDRVDRVETTVNKIEADIDKIYKNNQELSISIGGLKNELEQVRETLHNLPGDTKHQVQNAIDPVRKETQDLKDVIVGKEMFAVDVKKTDAQRRPWFRRWFWN